MLYMFTGIFSMASGPVIGKLSDSVGKYAVFLWGTLISCVIVVVYCNLGITPLWAVIIVNIIMFMAVSSRMISSSALMTAVPEPADRGAFMGINSSVQQISGGIATFIAGLIVVQTSSGKLENYDILGYTVVGASLLTAAMLYSIHLYVARKTQQNFQKAAA
jgi:MFS family permease